MEDLNTKKIFAISLIDKARFKAMAAFNGVQLVITNIHGILGPMQTWQEALIQEIEKKKAAGFLVLVEERTDHIAQYGTQFSFEDKDPWDNRAYYSVALDWYFALQNMGNLVVPKGAERYLLREQQVDRVQNEQGQTRYNIDWNQFNGGHRTILLSVMGAVLNPVTGQYIKEMYGIGPEHPSDGYDWRKVFRALTVDRDAERAAEWNRRDGERK